MKTYQLGGASFIVHEGKVYVELSPAESAVHEEERNSQAPRKPKNAAKGVRHCKACGKPGHRSDNCPQNSSDDASNEEESEDEGARDVAGAGAGGSRRPISGMSPADLGRTIQDFKAKGLTSVQVAAKLHCTLTLVNRFW